MANKRCWPGIVAVELLMLVVVVLGPKDNNDIINDDKGTDDDYGFSLLFQSNREEMLDVPLCFDPPLPTWLSGTLVRNGLGLFENGDRTFLHTFDAFAKLSSWRFTGNGSAFFSTRFLTTSFYNASMEGRTISPYLTLEAPQPPPSFLDRFRALARGLDNMNVNVYKFPRSGGSGHDYLALSDYWKGYTFSPRSLTTYSPVTGTLYQSLAESLGITSFLSLLSSAHPLPEPGTEHHLTFLSSMSLFPWSGNLMQLVRVKSTQQREIVASWPVERIAYMHSFSVTATHALLLAHPFYVNVMCMVVRATPFQCLDWHQDEAATLYVVELKTGRMVEMTMDNVFTMHHVNAYSVDQERLIMDLSTYPDPSFVGSLQLPVLRDPAARNSFPAHAQLQRYEVNLLSRTVTRVPMTTPQPAFINFLDMPTLNERYLSRRYCYVYGLVIKTDHRTLSKVAIVKRDMCGAGGDRSWTLPHHYPVEPVFIPHPEGVAEDEGVVLVPMIDGPSTRSYMAVLDARNLTLISSATLPTLVPYSLHGRFFPEIL